jgi:Uma2 family endonuclease
MLLRTAASSGKTVVAPAAIRFEVDHVLEPDVFWIRPDGDCKPIVNRYWQGAPDLVVEVLSPSTAKRDRGVKFDVYERHGVGEYWLIDPEARFVEVYQRANERFQRQGVYGVEDTFASAVLGVEVKVEAIFAD